MIWSKRGVIWRPDGLQWWARSHATCPTPLLLSEDRLRLYMQCRDANGIGRVGYIDVDPCNPSRVLETGTKPCLDIGQPGTFDENGITPVSAVKLEDGRILLYYIGFELGQKIRYRMFTGLAISTDGGYQFTRARNTPVLERSDEELYFRCGPFVMHDQDVFRMWYAGGSTWTTIENKQLPCYDLRYIESTDGINWPASGRVVLPVTDKDEHGFGRPWVRKTPSGYQMFFSVRVRSLCQYRFAYAESVDGLNWIRMDDKLGIDVSPGEWDSNAVMYAAVIQCGEHTWVFYNGNNFGETGIGYALLEAA